MSRRDPPLLYREPTGTFSLMELIAGLIVFAWAIYASVSIVSSLVRGSVEVATHAVTQRRDKAREAAAREERESRYLNELEPKWRSAPGYPPDWEIRRALVFAREERKCEECSRYCERSLVDFRSQMFGGLWSEDPALLEDQALRARHVSGGHVHHKLPISRGGDHSFDNLMLLCERCHSRQHPSNPVLAEAARRKESPHLDSANSIKMELKKIRRYSNSPDAVKLVRARTHWSCDVCGSSIEPGQSYIRGRKLRQMGYLQVCSSCQNLFRINP